MQPSGSVIRLLVGVTVGSGVAVTVGVRVNSCIPCADKPEFGRSGVCVPLTGVRSRPAGIVGKVALGDGVCDGVTDAVALGDNVSVAVLVKLDVNVGDKVGFSVGVPLDVAAKVAVELGVFVAVSVGGNFVHVAVTVLVGICVAGAFVLVTVGAVVGGAGGSAGVGFRHIVIKYDNNATTITTLNTFTIARMPRSCSA